MVHFIYSLLIPFFIILSTSTVFSQDQTLKKYSPELQLLILNEDAVFRGHQFGDFSEKIRAIEKGILLNEDEYLLYEIEINKDEDAEIIYYLNKKDQITGFGLELLVQTSKEELLLYNEFNKYYTEKFGKPKLKTDKTLIWQTKMGYCIEMGETNKDGELEIEIEYIQAIPKKTCI